MFLSGEEFILADTRTVSDLCIDPMNANGQFNYGVTPSSYGQRGSDFDFDGDWGNTEPQAPLTNRQRRQAQRAARQQRRANRRDQISDCLSCEDCADCPDCPGCPPSGSTADNNGDSGDYSVWWWVLGALIVIALLVAVAAGVWKWKKHQDSKSQAEEVDGWDVN